MPSGKRTFAGTGIPFGVIGRLADVVEDEQADHAGIFADTTNPDVPRTINNPIRLGFAQPRQPGPPPRSASTTRRSCARRAMRRPRSRR